MGRLTTHILNTAQGLPAKGVAISVFRIDGHGEQCRRTRVAGAQSNDNGRCDLPLLEGAAFTVGVYELEFSLAEYFAAGLQVLPDPPFVGDVVLRIGVADAAQHYHVPLLVSPWSYSTYRGS